MTKFSSMREERRRIDLHQQLDDLLDAGLEKMVTMHFAGWKKRLMSAAPKSMDCANLQTSPELIELRRDPRAYLPQTSRTMGKSLFDKFASLLKADSTRHVVFDGLRISFWIAEAIHVHDQRTGLRRLFVRSEKLPGSRSIGSSEEIFERCLKKLVHTNVMNLTSGRIKPECEAEAIEEIEAELKVVPPKYKYAGRPRKAAVIFGEWMERYGKR
jgi:hypothetical protein